MRWCKLNTRIYMERMLPIAEVTPNCSTAVQYNFDFTPTPQHHALSPLCHHSLLFSWPLPCSQLSIPPSHRRRPLPFTLETLSPRRSLDHRFPSRRVPKILLSHRLFWPWGLSPVRLQLPPVFPPDPCHRRHYKHLLQLPWCPLGARQLGPTVFYQVSSLGSFLAAGLGRASAYPIFDNNVGPQLENILLLSQASRSSASSSLISSLRCIISCHHRSHNDRHRTPMVEVRHRVPDLSG